MKKYLIISILIVFLLTVAFLWNYLNDSKDLCFDTGRCTEGLEVNTEHGKIKINKEN